jgi:phosphate-selective porin OprO and OprP
MGSPVQLEAAPGKPVHIGVCRTSGDPYVFKAAVTVHESLRRRNVLTTALLVLASLMSLLSMATPAAAQQASRKSEPESPTWAFAWGDHPSLQIGSVVRVQLRVQGVADRRASGAGLDEGDTARFATPEFDASRFDTARRRIGLSGSVGKVAEFQIERELSGGGWKDAFVNYRGTGEVQVQGGRFKLPFGLDENTSSSHLDFVYRSRAATELAPGRDLGVMAHGRAGTVRYEAGVFGHLTAAGRIVVQPFRKSKSAFEDLQAGVAYAASDVPEGMSDLRGETALGRRFFTSRFATQGTRHRLGVEARWRPGPFSVQSEFVRLIEERKGQSTTTTDLQPLDAAAWYVQGSWIVTGERKTKGADEPRRPLFDGGIGSIELAARVESLRFGSGDPAEAVFAPRAEEVPRHSDAAITFGLNWSPNRWIRLQANVVREQVLVPAAATWDSPSTFWSRVLRIRFAL